MKSEPDGVVFLYLTTPGSVLANPTFLGCRARLADRDLPTQNAKKNLWGNSLAAGY